jgi:RmlD substrate binding domain
MRILILGANGMLGHSVFSAVARTASLKAFGTLRRGAARRHFAQDLQADLLDGVDVLDTDALMAVIERVRPDVMVNCIASLRDIGRNPAADHVSDHLEQARLFRPILVSRGLPHDEVLGSKNCRHPNTSAVGNRGASCCDDDRRKNRGRFHSDQLPNGLISGIGIGFLQSLLLSAKE